LHKGEVEVFQHQVVLHHCQRRIEAHRLTRHGHELTAAGFPVSRLVQQRGTQAGHLVAANDDGARKGGGDSPGLGESQPGSAGRRRLARELVLVDAGCVALEGQPQPAKQGAAVGRGRGEQQGRIGCHGPD